MKKGKRKIVEHSSMFGQDSSQPTQFSANFSFDSNTQSIYNTNIQIQNNKQIQNKKLFKNNQTISINKKFHEQQNCQQQQNTTQKKQSILSQDIQRINKLKLLKQKYLTNNKNKPINHQLNKISNNLIHPPSNQSSQTVNKQLNTLSIQSHIQQQLPITKKSQQAKQPIPQKQEQLQNISQNQTNISISPITSITLQPYKTINLPEKKKNKKLTPPPPPIKNNLVKHQDEQKPHHENNTLNNEFNSSQDYQKTTNIYPSQIPTPHCPQTQDPLYIIRAWINATTISQPTKHKNQPQQQQTATKILHQLLRSQNIQEIMLNFIIHNTNLYSQQQANSIEHLITRYPSLSSPTKLLLLIKCGTNTLKKYRKQLDITKTLEQLLLIQNLLLENQKNIFIQFLLSHYEPTQQILSKLFALAPSNQYLNNIITNFQFNNITIITNILSTIKQNLTQKLCPLYFKLITTILPSIQDESILQAILQLITKINYQCAYQLKKDCKLRIIQKIDKFNNSSPLNKPSTSPSYQIKQIKQDERDKGFGMSNIMGYVNQTFKKIKGQIPQRPQPQTQSLPDQQPQSIVYDPISKRYLINGKIPEDEDHKQQHQEVLNTDKIRKKITPPPPPPRPIPKTNNVNSNKIISNEHLVDKKQKWVSEICQPISNVQQQESQYQNQKQQIQTPPPPPPPPRIGLKGMCHRKTKYPRNV